jgi:hypothetical protein
VLRPRLKLLLLLHKRSTTTTSFPRIRVQLGVTGGVGSELSVVVMEGCCLSAEGGWFRARTFVLFVNNEAVLCKHIYYGSATHARCCVSLGMGASVIAAFVHTSAASAHEHFAHSVLLESTLKKTLIL